MTTPELIERLARHRTIGSAPRAELEWIAGRGDLRHFEVGDVITRKDEPVEHLYIVLSGHFAIHVDRGAGPRRVMEWGTGDVGGVLPYSRLGKPPGEGIIETPGDVFMVHRARFPELIRACPEITAILVHVMLDRARVFTSSDLQDEKMISLGRLAAGLAHELNNPASAAARSATLLAAALDEAECASQAFGAAGLADAQRAAVERLRESCLASRFVPHAPLERADRQEAFAEWLDRHGASADQAGPLADTGMSISAFDAIAAALDPPALAAALRWLAAGCTLRHLTSDIEMAASRIHELVSAVKRFTYMDRHAVPEEVDMAQGLRDSVAVLSHKARAKSVGIAVQVDATLPKVDGFGGELNQVWANLIDNALDAVGELGQVTVTATRDLGGVVVHIVDNGPGIPADIRGRIFDPFFTTKPVGHGTGLGLDIAQRLVRRNHGEISVDSVPGRTEFRVWLPAAAAKERA